MATLMEPLHCSLYYLGLEVLSPQVIHGVQGGGLSYQDETAFRDHLEREKQAWARRLEGLGTEATNPFSGWDDWDEQ
ncbi:hypothetical protein [Halomonas nitroreducens]|uniref:Uncharacterized protein n=1 Tax=Halomonas nitroreducens TaxID=447425 RepID=A0A3S0J8F3_9GAMM|nr:hypothetical protein [Halomonas nitroreducens]RTR01115.1 hypothetical protein EKG36_14745 [Halomonas nitroreducens]